MGATSSSWRHKGRTLSWNDRRYKLSKPIERDSRMRYNLSCLDEYGQFWLGNPREIIDKNVESHQELCTTVSTPLKTFRDNRLELVES